MNYQTSRFRLSENLESYQLLWLDQNITEKQENLLMQKKLREVINQLIVFDKVDDCAGQLLNLSSALDENIILIVPDQFTHELLPVVHDAKQLCAVYVYCTNRVCTGKWRHQFSKVKCRYVESKVLKPTLI